MFYLIFMFINVRENGSSIQEWKLQRDWQHWADTAQNKNKTPNAAN